MTQPSFYDYLNHQIEDFVMDDAFQQWVRHPDAASNQFWQEFLMTYPNKRELIEEAAEMVRNIRYQPHTLSREKQEHILGKVYARAGRSAPQSKQIFFFPFHKKHMVVAATLSLLILSTVFFWLSLPAYDTYATGFQENQTISLADGTEVTLNANTKIKVNINLEANRPREVWVEGEAYFQVKRLEGAAKLPERQKFIVHTDNFDIEVLGTTFNVSSRARKSEVLLKSGKVKVASQQIEQTQILQPGDLLSLSGEDRRFLLKKTEPDTDLAWRDNFFIFKSTPLKEVARAIENYYGLKVEFASPQLEEKIFTASISRDELPMLLKAIEASFGVKVQRDQQIIRIQP